MTRSKTVWTLLVVGVAVALTVGGLPADPPAGATEKPTPTPAEPANPLSKRLAKVEFSGVPLDEVLAYFREVTEVNIVVKWPALEQAGIKRDAPVNLALKDVTAEKILKMMLASLGGVAHLDYVLDDNILTISTADDLARNTETMTYDVRDVIDWTDGEQVDNLLDLVRTSIEPDTWRDNAGTIGSVGHLNGALVVTNTPKVHAALARLLADLRASRARAPISPRARAQQTDVKIRMVGSMKQTVLDSAAMCLIAAAGLRDEVPRTADEVIKEYEGLLGKTKSLGMRNALRLGLKDLYKLKGDNEKVWHHLRQMFIENAHRVAVERKDAYSEGLFE